MTKEEIKKAAREKYPFPDGKIDFKIAIKRKDFEDGAEWAAEQMFTAKDLDDFAEYANSSVYNEIPYLLKCWLEGREKK